MRPCAHPSAVDHSGGCVINTPILLALFVAILVSLVLLIGQMLLRRQRRRDDPDASREHPRTEEGKARDRRTGIVWGCLALAVPTVLVLLYAVTR
ncbi:hypothetical protein ACT3SP_02640 [Brachybacterium sp. AOP43-C2-M15]|uniref:hypothetical protein n=1 Tax=Brachybacterium sp. AOP43-C2-M15 TaxID=3457661 RepID=UPI0040342081